MKTGIILIVVFLHVSVWGQHEIVDSALVEYRAGRFLEARTILETSNDTSAGGLFLLGMMTVRANDAVSLYRKALSANDITDSLSMLVYDRLASYYQALGFPGSTSVMKKRYATAEKHFADQKKAAKDISGKSDVSAAVHELDVASIGALQMYGLQVGAFGVKENAEKMKKDLEKNFSTVKIASGGTSLFRVVVGQFASEKEALSYGESQLTSRGISFRVITY